MFVKERITGLVGACLAPFLLLSPAALAGADHEFRLRQVAQGVYVHHGEHRSLEHPGRDDIANLGVVVGPDCIAVIDTGGSVEVGESLRQAIREVSDKPVCYVISTHIHFDHLLGNAAFAQEGTSFVGHWNLPQELVANREFFMQDFAAEAAQKELPEVDLAVRDSQKIDLGQGRVLELRAWPAAHTYSDLTVLDEATGVFFAGDLVFRERLPVIDGKLLGWMEVESQLRQIEVKLVVPGHGPVATGWDEALQAQSRYLQKLRDEVRAAVAKGVFMEDALDTVGVSERSHWELFDFGHRRNVSKAFVELEWE